MTTGADHVEHPDRETQRQALLNELAALRAAHDRQIALLNAMGEALERVPALDASTLADIRAALQPETATFQRELATLHDALASLRAEVRLLAVAQAEHQHEHATARRRQGRRRWWPWGSR